jgi:hypothetical protein
MAPEPQRQVLSVADQPRAFDFGARGGKKLEAVPDAIINEYRRDSRRFLSSVRQRARELTSARHIDARHQPFPLAERALQECQSGGWGRYGQVDS